MNGELAQLVAITAHGNAALHDGAVAELFPANSSFQFVNRVSFVADSPAAGNCASWWQSLKQRGIRKLRLSRLPVASHFPGLTEHHQVAFAGGLAVGIVAVSDGDAAELWRPRWQVTAPKDPNRLLWTVTYHGELFSRTRLVEPPPIHTAADALAGSLERIRAFAVDQGLEFWMPWFTDALALLASPDPVPPGYPDLLPPSGYPLLARQLLAATGRGWVFGGMGSWNDLSPGDGRLYEEVTQAYFDAVMNAVVAATNSAPPT